MLVRKVVSEAKSLRDEVLHGLQKSAKELPSKLFYDKCGSRLFDRICTLDEYYPTRTETAIMQQNIDEVVALMGTGCLLIEYGSGSSIKTRILLDHLREPAGYVPIDISHEHLMHSAAAIAADYPGLEVLPVCADYTNHLALPHCKRPVNRRVVYFPGSTIGNFHPREAEQFLRRIAAVCGDNGDLLIGVDLKKAVRILHDAYNDSKGVTAAFNLNMLRRLNRELGASFDLDQFRHRAFYNETAGRIEMHLVSLENQVVQVSGVDIYFEAGESIWTESSYKYSVAEFAALANQAGFQTNKVWTDARSLFSVHYLTTCGRTRPL